LIVREALSRTYPATRGGRINRMLLELQ